MADVRIMVHKSCALAAQTFMLAMSAAGADTCPMEGFDSKLVKNLLNLPKEAEVNMIISCGYRTEKGFGVSDFVCLLMRFIGRFNQPNQNRLFGRGF